MSSKSAKKKSSGAADEKPAKAMKMPLAYIVRPQSLDIAKVATVGIHPEVFQTLGFTKNQWIYLRKNDGFDGVIAVAESSTAVVEHNVVLVSEPLRRVAGLLLGDRVEFNKHAQQPSYATSVEVQVAEGVPQALVETALDAVGVISVGLTVSVDEHSMTVVAINHDLAGEMALLQLDGEGGATTLPTYIYAGPRTEVSLTQTSVDYTRYRRLPQPPTYNQVGGASKAIEQLKTTIETPLNRPEVFADFGISPPRGILLHGPPGTGKTMLLRCVAHETPGVHVLTVNGPLIVLKYLGETENALRDIFTEARKFQPSLVFMDEIDSLAPNRASDDAGETESRVVATLLTMMDGLGDLGRVVVVGATNRPNSIDPALRRPGRFDQEVEVGIPDVDARFDILSKQLLGKMNPERQRLSEDDIREVASKTHGYVGADLTALCRELVMKTIAHGEPQLTLAHMLEALPEIRPLAMREIFLEMPKVYWSDIGGQHELKKKLVEVVQLPLEAALAFANLGILAPKGVLLYGPPGCSKTLTAKALATELGLNFLAVKGPEILNKYVGELERTIREIFRKARAAAPLIIFFDEIDAISVDRELTLAGANVLTLLLNEIDGVEELKGVVIVAATNRPAEIDAALLRPGRLDRHIYVAPPDREARVQIITNGSKKFNLADDVSIEAFADATEGCSGAEVALLCQEAGLAAIMEDNEATCVQRRHFDHALAGISKGITPEMLQYYEEFASRGGLSM